MKTATELIFQATGLEMHGSLTGMCALCGASDTRGENFLSWVKKTFTNWSDIHPGGTIICDACEFCCREGNEILTMRLGSERPQKMRNYSHIVDSDGSWHPLSKAHKRRMYEFLISRQQPLVVVIADSGQKHLCFRARPAVSAQSEDQFWYPSLGTHLLDIHPKELTFLKLTDTTLWTVAERSIKIYRPTSKIAFWQVGAIMPLFSISNLRVRELVPIVIICDRRTYILLKDLKRGEVPILPGTPAHKLYTLKCPLSSRWQ